MAWLSPFLLPFFSGMVLAQVLSQGTQSSPIKLNGPIKIIPAAAEPSNLWGVVGLGSSIRQCGGTGQVSEWGVGICNPKYLGPCFVEAEQEEKLELVFIASQNSNSLNFMAAISVVGEAEEPLLVEGRSKYEGLMMAGERYAITVGVTHSSQLRGKEISAIFTVTREEGNEEEICATADWKVV